MVLPAKKKINCLYSSSRLREALILDEHDRMMEGRIRHTCVHEMCQPL